MGGLVLPPICLCLIFCMHQIIQNTMSFRSWVITLNNWTAEEYEKLITNDCLSFGVFGKEGKMGTPHIQGAMTLSKTVTLAWWKKFLPRAHVEPMRAKRKKTAFDYCKKEQDWEEIDNRKERSIAKKVRIQGYVDAIKEGKTLADIVDEEPVEAALDHRSLEWLCLQMQPARTEKPWVVWCYGESGSGKSFGVFHADGVGVDAYWHKCDSFKWWSLYGGQDVVVLEELRASHAPLNELLRLFDFVPLAVETKGGHVHMRAKTMYVTTPKDPTVFYNNDNVDCESITQLRRRVNEVVRFHCQVSLDEDGEPVEHYTRTDMTQQLRCGIYWREPEVAEVFYVASLRQPSYLSDM